MKGELTIFQNPAFGEVRMIRDENGNALFLLSDLCNVLGLRNPSSVKTRLDNDDVQLIDLHALNITEGSINGNTMANFVNESGFYDVLLQSKSTKVKPFRKWVTSDVLPSLRKHGAYMITREEDTPEMIMARAVLYANSKIEEMKEQQLELQQQLELKEKQIEVQAPKVEYYEEILKSNNLHTITTIAATYNMSAVTMNRILLLAKVIRRTGNEYSLTAKYQGEHIAKSEKFKYVNSKGETGSKNDLRWTEKGHSIIHDVVKRAINAGVVKEKRGRYILDQKWIANYYAGLKEKRQQGNIKSTLN